MVNQLINCKDEVMNDKHERVYYQKSNLRVLIVEDDLSSQPIWEYIFQQLSSKVDLYWATSVMEAEEILDMSLERGFCFDLIVSDIFLSGSQTGVDLWEDLQEGMPNMLILMSSSEPAKIKRYFKKEHPVKYIQKPFNIRETIEIVREVLDLEQKEIHQSQKGNNL